MPKKSPVNALAETEKRLSDLRNEQTSNADRINVIGAELQLPDSDLSKLIAERQKLTARQPIISEEIAILEQRAEVLNRTIAEQEQEKLKADLRVRLEAVRAKMPQWEERINRQSSELLATLREFYQDVIPDANIKGQLAELEGETGNFTPLLQFTNLRLPTLVRAKIEPGSIGIAEWIVVSPGARWVEPESEPETTEPEPELELEPETDPSIAA